MPKSKRNKIVDLSQARKHGKDLKQRLFDEIRSCVDNYSNVFVFSVTDMRNSKLKSVRHQWKHSRFFFGKNKVMALAFGRGPEDEYRTNLYKIGNSLKGQCGILFSNKSKDEVISWFSSYSEADFARSGSLATENVFLHEGPLLHFPHSLEPYFRTLGLPTALKKGVIHLVKDHEVCKIGDKLTPETARILKLLGYEMAEFHIEVECAWSSDGKFENLKRGSAYKESDSEEDKNENEDVMSGEESVELALNTSVDSIKADKNHNGSVPLKNDETKESHRNENCPMDIDLTGAESKAKQYDTAEPNKSMRDDHQKEDNKDIHTVSVGEEEEESIVSKDKILSDKEAEDNEENSGDEGNSGDEDNEKQDIINSVISDAKSFLSSPDEKSPVFRSLRSRTIKIPKSKKCTK